MAKLSEREPVRHGTNVETTSTGDHTTRGEPDNKFGLWRNIKQHPHAVAWSIMLSTAVIMEGFDIVLIQSLLAVDSFKKAFGSQLPDGTYQLTAAWQAGLTNGAIVGEMLGLMVNGLIADRFGFKKTMLGALAATTALIFIPFFATSVIQLLVGLILLGIPWGVFQTLTTTYAAEVCPTGLRPYLTTYVNLCWVIGQFLASGVLVGVQGRSDHWAYRIPYALQWIWPVPLMVGVLFAPESPWWLTRRERKDEARRVLKRLNRTGTPDHVIEDVLSMMKQTNDLESMTHEGTSYLDCFKGIDLRRTEIACAVWLIQTLAGATFMGYSTYFYESAGLESKYAFSLSLGQYALGAIGTILSWFLMSYAGRRTLYLSGLATLGALFLIVGFCGLAPESNQASRWAIGSMLLLFIFAYDCTIGPVCYCLVAEIPSTRLRQKTVVLARTTYNIGSIICNIIVTRQLNPTAWNWGAKSGFFWAGSCFICFTWAFFRLPEPSGRTFLELDALFMNKTPARKFKSANAQLDFGREFDDPLPKGPETEHREV
ncbi:sugar transporter [Polychaeton citri CBS 116435]|uniref:Sugar transporter n=1 Tax=Polychaeton citri CBS 116435 TaxID=1314669 RepID=A0A9P4Q3T7_9PEZI|nr:sugar transporter [Polychaeton citri CBS 116435]